MRNREEELLLRAHCHVQVFLLFPRLADFEPHIQAIIMPRLPRSLVSGLSSAVKKSQAAPKPTPFLTSPSLPSQPTAPSLLALRAHLRPSLIPHPFLSRSPSAQLLPCMQSQVLLQALPHLEQVRHAKRGMEYQPSQRKRKRKHGFLARKRSVTGRKILVRRLLKGRRDLTH